MDDEITWYRDWHGDFAYAARGPFARGGFFIADLEDEDADWEFLVPDSPRWDSFHQWVFRACRVDRVEADALPEALREVPPTPPGPYPAPESYVLPVTPLRASAALAARVPLTVYVVLLEDVYETRYGDGRFHYLESVHVDHAVAQQRARAATSAWRAAYVRQVQIDVHDGVVTFPGFARQPYDQHTPEAVLDGVETALKAET